MSEQSTHKRHRSARKPMKIIGWIVSLIQLAMSVLVGVLVIESNMLPLPYAIAVIVILIGLLALTRWMMWHYHPKKKFIAGMIISLILSIICGIGSYYLYGVVHTMKKITDANTETTVYGVYVLQSNSAEKIQDAADYEFGIMTAIDRENTDKVLEMIQKDTDVEPATSEYDDMLTLSSGLLNAETQAIVLNEAFINTISETEGYEDFAEQVKEIATYDVTKEVPKATVTIEDDSAQQGVFTVFMSGIDVAGPISTTSRSDVNILAVVNSNTHQVLLLSTPRDYYVPLSISNGAKDKLTHAGIYGINTSMDTLGMLYGTNVDYYFRINFSGFKNVINALGGVTVDSDVAFTAGGYSYKEGSNTLNADQALAFARERYSFAAGDRQRGKNQMAVIAGVINKMMSPAILSNYSDLMNGLEGSFETSMPYSEVSSLVQAQLNNGGVWNVQRYSVDGTGESNYSYSMPSKSVYVMVPDQSTVDQAKQYIEAVKNGEYLNIQ